MKKPTKSAARQPFMALIRRYCVPLHFASVSLIANGLPDVFLLGGSALLWESIEGRFIVTAAHVWRELEKRIQTAPRRAGLMIYDYSGPVLVHLPQLVDIDDDLDLAVFTVNGIRDFNPNGKEFFKTLGWPTPSAEPNDMVVGCGYPGDLRIKRPGHLELQMIFWANMSCSTSATGRRILLSGTTGNGVGYYHTNARPKHLGLPGISGAPIFALRETTLDWVGIVSSGAGKPMEGHSIQAVPSRFVGSDGQILRA